jgi:GNAT superfamily N-acetyltransferase
LAANPEVPQLMRVRSVERPDRSQWGVLWEGYNHFYGRTGETALPADMTDLTWNRFFDEAEPVFCLVAEQDGELVGIAHYVFHRSTTRSADVCYLQDLFTSAAHRGSGIGRSLIEAVYDVARSRGSTRVYWQTHETNALGRSLYDSVAAHAGFLVYAKELHPE